MSYPGRETSTRILVIPFIAGGLVATLQPPGAFAANSYWQATGGGDFNQAANWAPAPPGPSDSVLFTSNATYQVNWPSPATNLNASVPNGVVTLAMGPSYWLITGNYSVGSGGSTGTVNHSTGTLIVTNNLGTAELVTGTSGNRNYTLIGGTAIVDRLDYVDNGSASYCKLMHSGSLTTLRGSSVSVGSDFIFFLNGGQTGVWNMRGGTNVVFTPTPLDLYTQLGWAYDSRYLVNVDGPTTVWSNRLNLVVGSTSSGNQLNVTGGARVMNFHTWIGRGGQTNRVFVSGANSVWDIQGQLFLSENSRESQLIITQGGRVNNGLCTISRYTSGRSNLVVVADANSLWNNSANILLGDYGSYNQLVVTNGGRVNCQGLYVGGGTSTTSAGVQTNNSVWISDAGSQLNATSTVRIGSFAGKNRLVITNGGRMTGTSATIGSQSQSTNNVAIVTGANSSWTNSGNMNVGTFGGYNSLLILEGGRVVNTRGIIGGTTSNNSVVVSGPGSLWRNTDELFIGMSLTGGRGNNLFVSNGAVVLTTNLILSMNSPATNNFATVAGGCLFSTNAGQFANIDVRRGELRLFGGLIETDRLLLTNGAASRIHFKSGQLNLLNSTVNNAQVFVVGSGSNWANLRLLGGLHTFANGLTISSNSWLTGQGTVSGYTACAGTLSPGSSGGSLTFNNDLQLFATSDSFFEFGGYSAGSDYDFIQVNGNLTRDGNLRVKLINGFIPGPFDLFTIVQSSSASGTYDNVASGARVKTTDNLGSFLVTYDSSSVVLSDYQSSDLDGDGIEDAWASMHFGTTPLPSGTGPNDKFGDKDGDGASNYDEFITGTNPNNPADVFKLLVVKADANSVTLQFPVVFGRQYRFWQSTDLANWLELPVSSFIQPQLGVGELIDDGAVLGSLPFATTWPRFYRAACSQ